MRANNKDRTLGRFAEVILRTPKYALLATNLARDNRLPGGQKARAAASLGYALSPIDLLPGLIPVVGQLDDLAVLIGGLRGVIRSCPPEIARDHLERSGLDLSVMDEDLAAVGATGRWIASGAAGLVGRAAGGSASLAVRALRSLTRR